uniref:Glycerol-3-phosphate dehydrogenase [NAD(+)] n=1 Tax=Chrysotila carterae TaxID=13221 RepID=A0A7S4BTM4_CHRCT
MFGRHCFDDLLVAPFFAQDAKLPENVVAVPDLATAAKDATMLIFVLPHQFLNRICPQIVANCSPNAHIISLIKGIEFENNAPKLISSMISQAMGGKPCSVLMGANVANEVAKDEFCEATVGCLDVHGANLWHKCFDRPTFKINVVSDVPGVELCGALKNVVALGAGFCDGLKLGGNTKAAIVRIGLMEMKKFCALYFPSVESDTFFESCGVADLITTCYGGRNRKCAEAFVTGEHGKSWDEIEKALLNGQKLQGTITAKDVMICLKAGQDKSDDFPLFTTIHNIAFEGMKVEQIVHCHA